MKTLKNDLLIIFFIVCSFVFLIFIPKASASNVSFFIFDIPAKNVTAITNTTGGLLNKYTYNAFGTIKSIDVTVQNGIRYSGEQYESEAGIIFLRNRYYDPSIGRLISKDNFQGMLDKPQTKNNYPYCANNPIPNSTLKCNTQGVSDLQRC